MGDVKSLCDKSRKLKHLRSQNLMDLAKKCKGLSEVAALRYLEEILPSRAEALKTYAYFLDRGWLHLTDIKGCSIGECLKFKFAVRNKANLDD